MNSIFEQEDRKSDKQLRTQTPNQRKIHSSTGALVSGALEMLSARGRYAGSAHLHEDCLVFTCEEISRPIVISTKWKRLAKIECENGFSLQGA
jgi:hypothetical protein